MFSDARNVAGVHGQQRAHAGEAERESQRAAQHGEHGDLALTARRAHQQEIGDVGTGY
jgi:hypothetical protein